MTRIELKKIADALGETLALEQNLATLDAAIAQAAKDNAINPLDYTTFKSDVQSAKHSAFVLSNQKLPSDLATAAAAARQPKPAAPAPPSEATT